MDSLWTESAERPSFNKLRGDVKTDVLIIGGGMAGILCAYMLNRAGVDCMLLEAEGICDGISKNTTAKITLQHGLIYEKLIRKLGTDSARLYLEAQRCALQEYSELSKRISCDFELKDSYVYSVNDREKIEREAKALSTLGENAEISDCQSLPFNVAGAVRVKSQAQFHPLKFAFAISKGLPIYEHSKVTELLPGEAKTNEGSVKCKKIIIATHFPFLNKHGGYFLKMYQHRSYVLALEEASDVNGMYVDESDTGLSLRNYKNLLLLGGGAHRTGKTGGGFTELRRLAKSYYPDAREAYAWATQDCMTLDGIPYIGQYSKRTPNLYVTTGFNKWGMTSSMVSAAVLRDLILDRENDYANVFSPSRSIFHKQLAVNSAEALIGLLTPKKPRCPHLGCVLKYNKEEHSWDCPCHGSRFTEDGSLIDNPATADKKNEL